MKINRHSLISGLSYALDIAGKNNLSHSKSTAYLAVELADEIGITDGAQRLEIFYSALLHDIALSNSYERLHHCQDGEKIIKKLPLPESMSQTILFHHEFADGTGNFGLKGDEIPFNAGLICFASCFDDDFGKYGTGGFTFDYELYLKIEEWLNSKRSLFAAEITTAFENLIKRESFLLDYFNAETKYNLCKRTGNDDDVFFDYNDVEKFALCFADIIDQKSPFTYTHSLGIADLARKAAATLNYDKDTQNKMYIAGLLHDIGKLAVPVEILHKNGKLTPCERFEINKHTFYTRKILEQIEGFEEITEFAANHHEKIDGTGYPHRIKGEDLSRLERAMAICDVYQALTEERPYRQPLPFEKVKEIMRDMAEKSHLDKVLLEELVS